MYILGLNIGHNATACLLKDGKIVGCVSEERFSRVKNHSGMPFTSVAYLLDQQGIRLHQVDLIVLDDHYPLEKNPDFGKGFLEAYTVKPLSKRVISYLAYTFPKLFYKYFQIRKYFLEGQKGKRSLRLKQQVAKVLGVAAEQIRVIDHHLAHAFSVCFNLPSKKKTLIFTLDGEGSGLCATVNIFDGNQLHIVAKSQKTASFGYLYALATIFLGMKPLEHEFKVMGLAPYAKQHKVDHIYPRFKNLIWVDEGLQFQSKFSMPFADHFFLKEMKFQRFDVIAGAVQRLVEELTCEWAAKAIEKTGISDIALSGGVFMNVKANQKIAELPEVESIFIMPSSGDESNAIGCCFYGYKKYCEEYGLPLQPQLLQDLYLGPTYDDSIEKMIQEKRLTKRYHVRKMKHPSQEIAKLLAKGEIVARCSGKSEWGARALGNRSILANPAHPDTIRILNETIKDRDFWMPFTPSILDSYEKKYVINPKKIFAPYMVITFDSMLLARQHLPAAMHPYDFTIRPQILSKAWNREYYEIIQEFERLTGIGGILNTSFNLHGEPNVLTPEDALHTVENSDLKYLVLGDYLLEKR